MKHDHTECTHDIKLCDHCDVVYCDLCSKEWGQLQVSVPNWQWLYQNGHLDSPTNPLPQKIYVGDVWLNDKITYTGTTTNPVPETMCTAAGELGEAYG